MAMTSTQLERRVEQNSNDISSIYDLLAGIDRRLDAMDRRLDAMDRRLDAMDRRLDAMDRRLDVLTSQVGEILSILKGERP